MNLKIKQVSYHRNGVSGEGFHAVLFDWKDEGKLHHMVGTVFDGAGQCAVYDVQELEKGNIAFACGNSWRGDHFEGELREAIKKMSRNQIGPFALPDANRGKESQP
jgi:hypothetical protein